MYRVTSEGQVSLGFPLVDRLARNVLQACETGDRHGRHLSPVTLF
jgi:hypothetical protein